MNDPLQAELPLAAPAPPARTFASLADELRAFNNFGTATVEESLPTAVGPVPVFINEFWTARQRDAHRLHEVSYRACFKPQLPRFFIERLTRPGDVVFDPFMGRGTTLLEAALLNRIPAGNDANPLCRLLVEPRLSPPTPDEIAARLDEIPRDFAGEIPCDLLVFYHEKTLREICALREWFLNRGDACDPADRWLRMVALNRLTGHSPGFFSVYTLPPNQAVSIASQIRINARRNQTPDYRDTKKILLAKSQSLLASTTRAERTRLAALAPSARLTTGPSQNLADLPDAFASLTVTSPPFLNIVQYKTDNWLRCWFAGIDPDAVTLSTSGKLTKWQADMTDALRELRRITRPGGHIAFEVGEVRKGKVRLEENVVQAGHAAGLRPTLILINAQEFTKTANCWGVNNNAGGTNTNRIVLFQKTDPPQRIR